MFTAIYQKIKFNNWKVDNLSYQPLQLPISKLLILFMKSFIFHNYLLKFDFEKTNKCLKNDSGIGVIMIMIVKLIALG